MYASIGRIHARCRELRAQRVSPLLLLRMYSSIGCKHRRFIFMHLLAMCMADFEISSAQRVLFFLLLCMYASIGHMYALIGHMYASIGHIYASIGHMYASIGYM